MFGGGRASTYESLVRAYTPDLYRFAYWLCRDRMLAEDLVQETCLRAWRSWDGLKDTHAAKQWLFTILRREHARLFERSEPETVDLEDEAVERLAGHSHQPPLEVRETMLQLPEAYRLPLLLQVLGGFSATEIEAIMGCTEDAALARVSRARRMMRHALDGPGENKEKMR